MQLKIPSLVAFVCLISMASAVTCNTNYVSLNFTNSNIPTSDILISQCLNSFNETNISLTGAGVGNYINKSFNMDTISGQKDIKIKVANNIPIGVYPVTISFLDASTPITALITILPNQFVQGDVLIFPTNMVVNVQQGTKKTQNIQLTLPQAYPRPVTIQGINFNPDLETIKTGDLSLGQLIQGQTMNIPIVFDGTQAQVGTYQTILRISAIDSQGIVNIPPVNIQLSISSSISPIDSNTFSNKPTCSVSSSTMNLNATYTLSCTGVSNNIEVHPVYNEYFEGVSADVTSNVYQYTFKPVKFGTATIKALFTYKGSPIFSPYSQDVRISATSQQLGGTSLALDFLPALSVAKSNEQVIIQVMDNSSRSLVDSPSLYIDGVLITEQSGKSFKHLFVTGKNYSIRATAEGYNDFFGNFFLTQLPIPMSISPLTGDTNTIFNISNPVNATIFINGVKYTSVYNGILSSGINKIEAFKDGYIDYSYNLSVDSSLSAVTSGEFKKGVKQVFTLNKNATWEVKYKKDISAVEELKATGSGTLAEFTPDAKGIYILTGNGLTLWSSEIKGIDWGRYKILGFAWYLWVAVILLVVGFFYFRNGGGTINQVTPYS